MKTDKLFNATYSFLIGFVLIMLGIIILLGRKWLYVNVVDLFILAIFILSLRQFLNYFIGKEKAKKINFIRSFINWLFCIISSIFKDIPLSILPIVFGLYLFLNSVIKLINGVIYFKEKANGYLTELTVGFIYLIIAIPIIFTPIKSIDIVLVILGIYILLLGINYLLDFISSVIPIHFKNKLKRHIRISTPAVLQAIIPYTVLKEINYLIDKENIDKPFVYEEKQEDIEPDIEVFIHISNRGYNRLGHMDICYNGEIIAYGGYDDDSLRLFSAIADGVLFTCSREKYIPFCIEHSKKTLFAFGLKLTEKQKESIEKTINDLYIDTYPWYSPYEKALANNKTKKKINKNDYDDYASRLYQTTQAKFYKFKKGKFKKFFVVGTSCCDLADHIIGKSGIDLLKMYGVISPGAYYEYLNREFYKKNSMVVSRKIYNSKNVDKKKVKEIFKGFSR